MGRVTALQKPSGGVRGIVVGDIVRRIVARTISQQIAPAVEVATAPYQFALSTRAGTECVAHVLQSMSDVDPLATVVSIDGVGAFDLVSRSSMLRGLLGVEGGGAVLPFVRQIYGGPSSFLWDDATGTTYDIAQGEGGEQGDPLMPALYSLGQHGVLEAIARRLLPTERLFAFVDDLYIVCRPERVVDVYNIVDVELWNHAKIQIHQGKTQVWNQSGVEPRGIETLQAAAQLRDPDAVVWRGDTTLPEAEQGMKILGTLLGHPQFVQSFLRATNEAHAVLVDRIPAIPDLQSAWLVLLFCASSRANYLLSALHPAATQEFASVHDNASRVCLSHLLDKALSDDRWDLASLLFYLGGLGHCYASRSRFAAHWSSWADCLETVKSRHPPLRRLSRPPFHRRPHSQGVSTGGPFRCPKLGSIGE